MQYVFNDYKTIQRIGDAVRAVENSPYPLNSVRRRRPAIVGEGGGGAVVSSRIPFHCTLVDYNEGTEENPNIVQKVQVAYGNIAIGSNAVRFPLPEWVPAIEEDLGAEPPIQAQDGYWTSANYAYYPAIGDGGLTEAGQLLLKVTWYETEQNINGFKTKINAELDFSLVGRYINTYTITNYGIAYIAENDGVFNVTSYRNENILY